MAPHESLSWRDPEGTFWDLLTLETVLLGAIATGTVSEGNEVSGHAFWERAMAAILDILMQTEFRDMECHLSNRDKQKKWDSWGGWEGIALKKSIKKDVKKENDKTAITLNKNGETN